MALSDLPPMPEDDHQQRGSDRTFLQFRSDFAEFCKESAYAMGYFPSP